MGLDDLNKTMENKSAMADENDRCKECGCLLMTSTIGDVQCKNTECKKFNLIVRMVK
jgi:hypothetical protein